MRNIIVSALFCIAFYSLNVEAIDIKQFSKPKPSQLTYEYTQKEVQHLKDLPKPSSRITNEELTALIKEVSYVTNMANLSGIDQTLLPAYLANAQKDFAWISYLLAGEMKGNLGPVTLWTLQLFIPNASLHNVSEKEFDVFSSCVAALVVSKAADRLQKERIQLADYPIKKGPNLWKPTSEGYRGLKFGSAKTWFLNASDQFLAEAPIKDRQFWEEQCRQVKLAQKNLDGKKTEAVYEWAGLTSYNSGSWEWILNDYLAQKNIPIQERLFVRSLVLSALADSNAVSFNSKYTYWVMRPSQMDPEIRPMIVIPNHPSFPSAHSTISSTAATILSELYPQDRKRWSELTEEAGMSRIWGGIHYPIDHKAGLELGNKVGEFILLKIEEKENSTTR